MSNIFEALQRSEADRSDGDSRASAELTDLLRRVERRATSKWEATLLNGTADRARGADQDRSFATSPLPSATVTEPSVTMEASRDDRQIDILSQFPSIQTDISPDSRLVCLTDKESAAAESFRLLGVRLRHLGRSVKKVLITSTIPQEGKSMIAANLACALASETRRVLLVEGDVRRPVLSTMFGLGTIPGLCEWLQGESSLSTCVYRLESSGVWICPSGRAPDNPLKLLQLEKLSSLTSQLAEWFDWIIIDSPPVLPVADTSVWLRLADGVLLVTRRGTTEKRQLEKGLEAIESKKLIGAILNSSIPLPHSDYYYGRPADLPPA